VTLLSPGRPVASLSLDLDNLWSYKKTRGDPDWVSLPSYLPVVVPRLLDVFGAAEVTATVFVVGTDADRDRDEGVLAAIPAAGHEVANHSFSHEPWLHLYEPGRLVEELARTEEALVATTGVHPTGFRGPGYSLSEPLLRELARRGYVYDASTLPTWIGPLARAYYFRSAGLSAEDRRQRSALFGSARDGLRPLAPYTWDLGTDGRLLEIPVTTAPVSRIPFHLSYVLHLYGIAPRLAWGWFDAATRLCRRTGLGPSVLLHPLDLLGADDAPGLEFFPGMTLTASAKVAVVGRALRLLRERFTLVPVGEHARRLLSAPASLSVHGPGQLPHGAEAAGRRRPPPAGARPAPPSPGAPRAPGPPG